MIPMRKALKQLNGERRRFSGTFVRTGQKPGWKGSALTTILLKDIKDANGRIVSDHLWFNLTKEFDLALKEGDVISFDARVKLYYKGYRGYREDVDKPVEMDFKLSHPTKVVRVEEQKSVWHLLKHDHEVYCGENKANTIATDDVSIVECTSCLKLKREELYGCGRQQ